MQTQDPFTVTPIGIVRTARADAIDDQWGGVESRIELDPEQFSPESTTGLASFSHIEVVFLFHKVGAASIETGARHPRERTDWPKVGIFAQRGKGRPNRVGVSRCNLIAVDGLTLTVRRLDAIDGTPVLDVKPWVGEFGPIGAVTQPAWITELMINYFED